MNKPKKSDPKKILVRNTERPVPKTRLVVEDKAEETVKKKPEVKEHSNNKNAEDKPKPGSYRSKFHSPELNTALQIAKKIDKVEKVKTDKIKSVPDIAFCEKVTRKMNFPSDQAIYKDLIPLEVPPRTPTVLTSREPLPQKDKEPVLASFVKPRESKEFIYQPSIHHDKRQTPSSLNNLRLYKIMQLHQ